MNNVVLVSGVQQSDSVVHIHVCVCVLFPFLFPYRSVQSVEFPVLCSRSCWLPISYTAVCTCQLDFSSSL